MKKIILDTDIGGDCDDTGALAIIQQACKKNYASLLAVTISTNNPYSPATADAINRYYQNVVPIGQTQEIIKIEDKEFYVHSYGAFIHDNCDSAFKLESGNKPQDAVKLLRKTLAQNDGEKITLVVIGYCVNIAGLLNSTSDEYSSLSGVELVKEKVDKISLMGCFFEKEFDHDGEIVKVCGKQEWNIKTDVKSAITVFSKCPVPIIVSHFTLGHNVLSGGALIEKEPSNPVAKAYKFHSNGSRFSWDPVSSYYAVYGCGEILTDNLKGVVSIDDTGVSTFSKDPKGLHVLLNCVDYKKAEKVLDDAMLGNL